MSGRGGSGSLGSGRTAGYAIGEGRTSPLEPYRVTPRPYPRLGSKPVPAPQTRHEVRVGHSVGLSPTRDPQRAPPSERHGCVSCAIIWVCHVHNMGVPCTWHSVCSVRGTPKVCHNMGVPWHSPNRCTRMQDMRPNHRRAAHQSEPAGRAHAPLCLTPINSEAPPHHPIGTATK